MLFNIATKYFINHIFTFSLIVLVLLIFRILSLDLIFLLNYNPFALFMEIILGDGGVNFFSQLMRIYLVSYLYLYTLINLFIITIFNRSMYNIVGDVIVKRVKKLQFLAGDSIIFFFPFIFSACIFKINIKNWSYIISSNSLTYL